MPGSLRLRDSQGSPREIFPERSRREDLGIDSVAGDLRPGRWSIGIGARDVAILWVVWAGTMLIAFLLGNSLGRHQGVRSALEDHGQEAVRVPLPLAAAERADRAKALQLGSEPRYLETQRAIAKPEEVPMSAAVRAQSNPVLAAAQQVAAEQAAAKSAPAAVAPASIPSKDAAPALLQAAKGATPQTALQPGTRWIVQAASFRNREQAQSAVKRFRALGLPVLLDSKNREGSKYFRIILGPYASAEKAAQAKDQAARSKIVKGDLYVKQLPAE